MPVSSVPLPIKLVACTVPFIVALPASNRPVEIPVTLNFPVSVRDDVVSARVVMESVLIFAVEIKITDEI